MGANSEPLTSVYDCVNVVTGDFFPSDNALQVNAVIPLCYNRFYDTGDGRENRPQGRGFGVELPLKINAIVPQRNAQGISECLIYVEEQEGANVIYKGRMGSGFTQATASAASLNKHGYTNYATAGIPGSDCIKKNFGNSWPSTSSVCPRIRSQPRVLVPVIGLTTCCYRGDS